MGIILTVYFSFELSHTWCEAIFCEIAVRHSFNNIIDLNKGVSVKLAGRKCHLQLNVLNNDKGSDYREFREG